MQTDLDQQTQPIFTKPNVYRYLGLAGLLVIGLLLRWPNLEGLSSYTSVELVRDLAVLRDLAAGHPILTGPPTVHGGFHFGPAYYYLSLPLAWLAGFRPFALALTSLMFSLGSIVLLWQLGRRWFADRPAVAWLAASLLTVSALDVQFAKYGSNPNALPFFSLMLLLALTPFLRGRGRWTHAALAGLAFGIGLQLHLVGAVAMTVFMLAVLASRLVRPRIDSIVAFVIAVLLANGPYLTGLHLNGFADVVSLGELAAAAPAYGTWLTRLRDLATMWISLWLSLHHLFSLVFLKGWTVVSLFAANIVLLTGIFLLDKRRNHKTGRLHPASQLLLLWLASTQLTLLFPWGSVSQVFVYYFVPAIPVAYLLGAVMLDQLLRSGRRTTATAILLSFIGWQAYQLYVYHLLYPHGLLQLILG